MTEQSLPLKQLEGVFTAGPRPVVGLVEELMAAVQSQAMRLEWEDGQCIFQCLPLGTSPPSSVEFPQSVFRAILARFASLCHDRSPESVSPYGGGGELVWDSQRFRIELSNDNQQGYHVEIFPVKQPAKPSGAISGNIVGPMSNP